MRGVNLREVVPARLRPLAWDTALAVAMAIAGFTAASTHHGSAAATGLLFVLAAFGTLPLAVRRLYPVPVLAVVVAVAAIAGFGYDGWWPFAAIVALYTVAAHCPRRTAIVADAATVLVLGAAIIHLVDWSPLGWDDFAVVVGRVALLLVAWLLGDNLRTRGPTCERWRSARRSSSASRRRTRAAAQPRSRHGSRARCTTSSRTTSA